MIFNLKFRFFMFFLATFFMTHVCVYDFSICNAKHASANSRKQDAQNATLNEDQTSIRIGYKGNVKTYNLSELKKKYKEIKINIDKHPAYNNSTKQYLGFDFLNLMQSDLVNIGNFDDYKVIITCTDGYRPVLELNLFTQHKAYLAYREDNLSETADLSPDKMWTLVKLGEKLVSPGHFYLIWDSKSTYPDGWPFQIQEISLVRKNEFEDYKKLAPVGAFNARISKGYDLFVQNCSVCHSIQYVGPHGKAPDLAYVTGYREEKYILNLLKNGRGAMPSFDKVLSHDQKLSIYEFLKSKATEQ